MHFEIINKVSSDIFSRIFNIASLARSAGDGGTIDEISFSASSDDGSATYDDMEQDVYESFSPSLPANYQAQRMDDSRYPYLHQGGYMFSRMYIHLSVSNARLFICLVAWLPKNYFDGCLGHEEQIH